MAGVAFVVGFSVLEDEAVSTLQAIGTLFHTVWTVFEMKAFHTMLWALRKKKKKRIFIDLFFVCLIVKTLFSYMKTYHVWTITCCKLILSHVLDL